MGKIGGILLMVVIVLGTIYAYNKFSSTDISKLGKA